MLAAGYSAEVRAHAHAKWQPWWAELEACMHTVALPVPVTLPGVLPS